MEASKRLIFFQVDKDIYVDVPCDDDSHMIFQKRLFDCEQSCIPISNIS